MTPFVRSIFQLLPSPVRQSVKTVIKPSFFRWGSDLMKPSQEELVKRAASGLPTADYQIPVLLRLLALCNISSFDGLRVCEIGGDGQFGIAQLWHRLTCQPVAVSNPFPNTELSDADLRGLGIVLSRTPFEEMSLSEGSLDIIYGCAVMEHICDMHNFFKQAFKILAPGGWAILHGCPLWNCYCGHHTYLHCDETLYAFGNEDCPVPNFSHLYMQKSEMHEFLIHERGLPTSHVDAICDQIYDSNSINRMSIAEISAAVASQPWQETRMVTELDYAAQLAREILIQKGLAVKDVQRGLIYLAVKKPDYI